MTAVMLGLVTALGWGSADFIARYTSRSIGHHLALFGMLAFSAVAFSFVWWAGDGVLVWNPSGLWSIALMGIGMMAATLLLYQGLARGPISIVAPIVGSYPIINIVFAIFTGAMPGIVEWAAIVLVMGGVFVVAKSSANFIDGNEQTKESLKVTVVIALAAAIIFGFTIIGAQEAGRIYGELAAVCLARWVSLGAIILVIARRRQSWRIPRAWWPLICLQGGLDGLAYLTLSAGDEFSAVVASTFSIVTIMLARLVLKESISPLQWGGITMIVFGVGVLMSP